MKLVVHFIILFFCVWLCVADFGAPSPPLRVFYYFTVTNFHSAIIKASSLSKAFYNELDLSLQAFASKVKPCRRALRVHFFGELNAVSVGSNFFYCGKIAWLKVAAKDGVSNRDNARITRNIFSMLFIIENGRSILFWHMLNHLELGLFWMRRGGKFSWGWIEGLDLRWARVS